MHELTAIILASIIIGLPTLMIMLIANRFFKFRAKKLEVEAMQAAEKALNMLSIWSASKPACACLNRSPPTAVPKPPSKSKPSASTRGFRSETRPDESFRVCPRCPDPGVRLHHHPAQDGHSSAIDA